MILPIKIKHIKTQEVPINYLTIKIMQWKKEKILIMN